MDTEQKSDNIFKCMNKSTKFEKTIACSSKQGFNNQDLVMIIRKIHL